MMKIERLYDEVREALAYHLQDSGLAEDFFLSIVKAIPNDAILRALRQVTNAPEARDFEIEEMWGWADSVEEVIMELEDKCETCHGSGKNTAHSDHEV